MKASKINYTKRLTLHAIRLVAIYAPLEDRSINDVVIDFFTLYYLKEIDSILPCLCSVIDHRMSKCGKNISDTLAQRLVCHFFVRTTF